jgi:hypothetical protein
MAEIVKGNCLWNCLLDVAPFEPNRHVLWNYGHAGRAYSSDSRETTGDGGNLAN